MRKIAVAKIVLHSHSGASVNPVSWAPAVAGVTGGKCLSDGPQAHITGGEDCANQQKFRNEA